MYEPGSPGNPPEGTPPGESTPGAGFPGSGMPDPNSTGAGYSGGAPGGGAPGAGYSGAAPMSGYQDPDLSQYVQTVQAVLIQPAAFFATLSRTGGYMKPF